jgi:sugar-specific transcriptional regulator TrmB
MAVMSPTYNKKKERNLNNSINIRSNKKAMNAYQKPKHSEKKFVETPHEDQTPDKMSDSDVSLDLPSMRSESHVTPKPAKKPEVINCNVRIDTNMKQFEKNGGR